MKPPDHEYNRPPRQELIVCRVCSMRQLPSTGRGELAMTEYVWLFPIIFIFHDMEEIIGIGLWLKKNKDLLQQRYPWVLALYKDFSTEGFALAVFEELVLCILLSLMMKVTGNLVVSYIWLGAFIGCAIHFVIHMAQAIIMKMYIPTVITSIICLPISVWIIYQCLITISGSLIVPAICMVIGMAAVAINLTFAQTLIGWFTRKHGIKFDI